MNAVNNFPKPVIIGVVVVLLVVASIVIFRTATNIATNNGYGTRESIANLQKQGAGQGGGRTAPTISSAPNGGGGRGGYPAGYGRGPNGR